MQIITFILGFWLGVLVLIPLVDMELSDGDVKTPWGYYQCEEVDHD